VCDGCGGTYTIKAFAKAVILGFGAQNPRSARTFYWFGNVSTLIFYLVSLTIWSCTMLYIWTISVILYQEKMLLFHNV
jgi:hypothetical protein